MHAVDEYLITLNADEGLLDAAFSHAEGFYLGTGKGDAGLVFILDKIVMICLFIVGNHSISFLFCHSFFLQGFILSRFLFLHT